MSRNKKIIEINIENNCLKIGQTELFTITENSLKEVFDVSEFLEMCKNAEDSRFVLKCMKRGNFSDFNLIAKDVLIEFRLWDMLTRSRSTLILCEKQCKEFGITYGFNKEYYFKTV